MKFYILLTFFIFISCKKEKLVKTELAEVISKTEEVRVLHLNDKELIDYFNSRSRYHGTTARGGVSGVTCLRNKKFWASENNSDCAKISKENQITYKSYGTNGYLIVLKYIHMALENHYSNCKKYPTLSEFKRLFEERNKCISFTLDDFSREVLRYFKAFIDKDIATFKFIEKEKEALKVVFKMKDLKKPSTPIEQKTSDISSLFIRKSNARVYYCKKNKCIFTSAYTKNRNENNYFNGIISCSFGIDRKGSENCGLSFKKWKDIVEI